MLRGAFPFVLSEALLAEYRNVLERPNLRRLRGLTDAEVEVLLTEIAQCAFIVAPAVAVSAPDAGDQRLWDLLTARADLVLVTGISCCCTIRTCGGGFSRPGKVS
jgi:uncharacterized protein